MTNIMKKHIVSLFLITCFAFGQNSPVDIDTTINKTCEERGHINNGITNKILIYCPPYVIDTDSTTVMVYPGCNLTIYKCVRCGKQIEEEELERRVVIWRRN